MTAHRLPRMLTCRQRLYRAPLAHGTISELTRAQLAGLGLAQRIRPGHSVAIGAGSRGIANYDLVMQATVDHVKFLGATPFIFPAMGSHGGATAEGQAALLAGLGIDERSMGCPIRSSMDVVELGRSAEGLPVYLDKHAAGADAIIVVNRVKPHTNFRGHVESGLMKMLAIGTGKQAQAFAIHKIGARGLSDFMPGIGRVVLAKAPVVAGVAILEDACHATTDIVALAPQTLEADEAKLLDRVRSWSPKLPVDDLDLLICERIGKDVSGTGMDTNVIGRVQLVDFAAFDRPRIHIIVGLGLTEGTHGNAIGMGLCDLITRRLADAVDPVSTRVNVITGQCPKNGAMPPVMETDRDAIVSALEYLVPGHAPHEATVIRLADTLHLDEFQVSEALVPALAGRDGIELVGEAQPLTFAADGSLI
ncbi:hypothetical protein LBMAG53_20500 [Planctomycetota bacterium]|nr:hypothetical protein LBMAG53_20500 [Planctomycetota bacterium]